LTFTGQSCFIALPAALELCAGSKQAHMNLFCKSLDAQATTNQTATGIGAASFSAHYQAEKIQRIARCHAVAQKKTLRIETGQINP